MKHWLKFAWEITGVLARIGMFVFGVVLMYPFDIETTRVTNGLIMIFLAQYTGD